MKTTSNLPKKILMTADSIGGVWNYSVDLCRKFGEHKIKVALAVMGEKLNPQQLKEISGLPNVILYQSAFKLEWMENPWNDVDAAGNWLLDIQNKFKPDVIHLNCYSPGSLKWKAPVVVVAHSDVFSWYQSVKKEEPPADWKEYYLRVLKGISNADYLIAPSNFMLNVFNKNFGGKIEQRVIYNARNRRLINHKPKTNFIIGVGRVWDEAKNLLSLVNVSDYITWPVYIAGENKNPDNGNSFNISNINFLGRLSFNQVAGYLSAASIYVLPAKYEPFGLTVLEAALSRCALILGDIPSLREIWGDNAIYINPWDEKALKDALIFLIKDENFRNDLAEKAFRHSLNFSMDRMCSEYLAVYSYIIKDRRTKRRVQI